MPTKHKANEGDCLCVIAMENGFLNCQPLRDEPQNATFLHRPLQKDDVVTVPDVDVKHFSRSTDQTHTFVANNAPPVSIRFVRGSSVNDYRDDREVTILNVSNFPTELGGVKGDVPFPAGFGFHPDGQADPDAFKVEVVDPAAAGSLTTINIESLLPTYEHQDGKIVITGHQQRKYPSLYLMECALISSDGVFLSKYLRVVTHTEDEESASGQTVLVVSPSDGKGTGSASDVDNVEILDFNIRASYSIARCTAPKKCAVSISRPLGDPSEKRRFRIAFHIFRRRDTGTPVGDLTVQQVRHAALTNLRAFYAQASMAPKLVGVDGSKNGAAVVFMPEPDNNMIAIGGNDGGASGHNRNGDPSTLTIWDSSMPIAAIKLKSKIKPFQVAAAIKNALDGSGYNVEIFKNPKPDLSAKYNPYDVIVTRVNGSPVNLGADSDDTTLGHNKRVVRVDIREIPLRNDAVLRRIFRSSPGPTGALNVYAVEKIVGGTTAAFSVPISFKIQTDGTQARQIADSIFCESQWLTDTTAAREVVVPHECGHVLGQVGHVSEADPHQSTEMMTGEPVNPFSGLPEPGKRISDFPILVKYRLNEFGDIFGVSGAPWPDSPAINPVNRFTTKRPDLLEKW